MIICSVYRIFLVLAILVQGVELFNKEFSEENRMKNVLVRPKGRCSWQSHSDANTHKHLHVFK